MEVKRLMSMGKPLGTLTYRLSVVESDILKNPLLNRQQTLYRVYMVGIPYEVDGPHQC